MFSGNKTECRCGVSCVGELFIKDGSELEMGKFKVRVNSEAESREIQNILESIGFRERDTWNESGSIGGFIWTDSDMTFCDNKIRYFDESPRKEITLPELRAMVNPMKEFLNKKPDGSYELIVSNGGCVDRDWIEIPEGAEIAIQFKNDPDEFGVIFYKNNGKSCFSQNDKAWQNDADWTMKDLLNENYCEDGIDLSHDVLWQRTQSLNDQYAEIEKVRQTLNERQSQYGSFKDVADTTSVFMGQFELDRMSNVQREALHMICSKLARIANGDPNHADSWHDIAGYATLVVDDLES